MYRKGTERAKVPFARVPIPRFPKDEKAERQNGPFIFWAPTAHPEEP